MVDYFPYGKVLREYVPGNIDERFLTTYHERDHFTGLDYRGARFYDSDVGRFLSLDPLAVNFADMSPYNYVFGNPISLIDPSGMAPEGWSDDNKELANRFGLYGNGGNGYSDEFGSNSNDYFSSEGEYLGSGGNGSNIRIVKKGSEKDKRNFGKNSKILSTRPITAGAMGSIGNHYMGKYGLGDYPVIGLIGAPFSHMANTNGDGSADVNNIFTNPVISISMTDAIGFEGLGRITSDVLNNKYNFASTLQHESVHYRGHVAMGGGKFSSVSVGGSDIGNSNHLITYLHQVRHPIYQHTTPRYQRETRGYIQDYYNGIKSPEIRAGWSNIFKFLN